MKIEIDCINCITKAMIRLIKLCITDEKKQMEVVRNMLMELSRQDYSLNPVLLSNKLITQILAECKVTDPFYGLKVNRNEKAWNIYPYIKERVMTGPDSLKTATLAAAAGNILDFVASGKQYLLDQAIGEVFDKGFSREYYTDFKEKLEKSETILYIGDNSGEIVMDRPLVKELHNMGKKITYCVRGMPAMDDALEEDFHKAGLSEFADLIDTGSSHMGLALDYAPQNTRDIFYNSDMIISKGMGNFEMLWELDDERIFFIFKAKCQHIAQIVDVELGEYCLLKGDNIGRDLSTIGK